VPLAGLPPRLRVVLSDEPPVSGSSALDRRIVSSPRPGCTNSSTVGLIMTGMGRDGVEGCKAILAAGGLVLGQDESSSVVYGMNKAAFLEGAVKAQFSLDELPGILQHIAAFRAELGIIDVRGFDRKNPLQGRSLTALIPWSRSVEPKAVRLDHNFKPKSLFVGYLHHLPGTVDYLHRLLGTVGLLASPSRDGGPFRAIDRIRPAHLVRRLLLPMPVSFGLRVVRPAEGNGGSGGTRPGASRSAPAIAAAGIVRLAADWP